MSEIENSLKTLGISTNIEKVTLREVNNAFRKLAIKLHPDKAGDSNTAVFQEVRHAHEVVTKYLRDNDTLKDREGDNDDEEIFFRDNFHRFNFPFENKGSFTVQIEDSLANTWQQQLEILLGEPKIVRNSHGTECDRSWKIFYSGIYVTIHIYNNPKNMKGSKLLLQGSQQSIICSYVFQELPRIYKLVCCNIPLSLEISASAKKSFFYCSTY